MNIKFLVTLFLCLGSVAAFSQTIKTDTISWVATKAVNQVDQSEFAYNGTFITYGTSALDWSQREGRSVKHYTVISADGSWNDLDTDGQKTFQVQNGEVTGTLVFARSTGVITVHLQLLVSGKPDQDYLFYITSTNTAH